MREYFFYIWFTVGFFHMAYLSIKMLPHFRDGYGHYFWLGFWLYNPKSLDEDGQRIRKIMIIAMAVYFIVGIAFLRMQ